MLNNINKNLTTGTVPIVRYNKDNGINPFAYFQPHLSATRIHKIAKIQFSIIMFLFFRVNNLYRQFTYSNNLSQMHSDKGTSTHGL